ncbi:hypothetical protein [Eudoraea adriatica]|uniref:hypothetical protein n=1 Tax=Eudoraea adriatica TaxID=446681 RepID=UPI00035D8156|nr:hypothetical protein [Eudoraea adriatica]
MKTNLITTLSIFLLVFLTISTAFSQARNIHEENPIEYFNKRTEALSLAKNQKWQELIPIVENLTQQYQKDGDLFYIIGLAYYETKQYQKAITALKNTLDLGGTNLSGIPTGSRPSNDIMIKIAKAYALNGDKSSAMLWLQKGFAARYDEKPFLKDDPAFKAFKQDEDYLSLFGNDTQEEITREEAWAKDLDYLEKRTLELHYNLHRTLAETDFTKSFLELKSSIDSLSDEQIIVELMRVFGGLGNGHNLILATSPKVGALKKLPVQFYQFNDGVFIIEADENFEQWIGYKVESIENTPVEEVLQKTNAVNARDNDMQTLWWGSYYMGLPDVLESLGIIKKASQVTITLSDKKGKSQKVTMNPISWNFDTLNIPKLKIEPQPLFLSKMDDPYWFKLLPEYSTIYIQFNVVTQKEEKSIEDFNMEIRTQIAQNKTGNLILDLRHNHGGDGSLLPPMLKTIMNFEFKNPNGKIFVIMGRGTFSAGQNLLTDITSFTNAILVGEPSGSKPNHIGDAGWFQLPYSGLKGIVSTQFHQTSTAEDFRKWIAPHIPVTLSSTDYFEGNDNALDTIFEVIKTTEFRNKN